LNCESGISKINNSLEDSDVVFVLKGYLVPLTAQIFQSRHTFTRLGSYHTRQELKTLGILQKTTTETSLFRRGFLGVKTRSV